MKFWILCLLAAIPLTAQDAAVEKLLDRIVAQEQLFLDSLSAHAPLFETYIQESPQGTPNKDHYFLGRVRIMDTVGYEPLIEKTATEPHRWRELIFIGRPSKNWAEGDRIAEPNLASCARRRG